jgi:hypothetical protein
MKTRKIIKQDKVLERLVDLQLQAEKLPRLSDVEKAKFDQNLALDQLYYSSKLEGSNLTREMMEDAIYVSNH